MKNTFRFFLIWLLCCFSWVVYGQPTLLLADTLQAPQKVYLYMAILEDTSRKLTIEQVSTAEFQDKFYYNPVHRYNFGFSQSHYWLRFQIQAPPGKGMRLRAASPWIVYIPNPLLGYVSLYSTDSRGVYVPSRAGSHVAITQRAVPYRYPVFRLYLLPNQKKTIYLHVDGQGPTDIPVWITPQLHFRTYDHREQFIQGIFYGIMVVMTIYNFVLFIFLNDRSYLYYVLYLIFGLLFHLSVSGYGYELFWRTHTWWATHSILISSYLSVFFGLFFCVSFLELRLLLPSWFRICMGYTILGIFLLILSLFIAPLPALMILAFFVSVFIALSLAITLASIRNHNPLALYLLIAWAFTFISLAIAILTTFGLIFSNTIAIKSLQVGLICDVVLLSVALARKISIFKNQKLIIEQEKQVVEENQKTKEKILATMSHEIRTPLNAVIGFAKLLRHTTLSQTQSDYVQHIHDSADNLLALINDILDLSKINAGKVTFEQVEIELNHLIKLLLETLQFQIQTKNLDVVCDIHPDVPRRFLGDMVRLNQILLNLMSNAVKFTHEGRVTLRIRLQQIDKQTVTLLFEVEDTGIGIPEEKLSSIFEGFTQATEQTTRMYGGTGLGLSIVKQLVEMQGGQLQVRSHVGEGSVFSVSLPFYRIFNETIWKGIQKNTPHQISSNHVPHARILIIDDNPLNLIIAKNSILHAAPKLQVETANNGLTGLQEARTHLFDVLLIDLQMPEMDGFQVARELRSDTRISAQVLLIALTASTDENEHQEALAVGMDDVLTKPFEANALFEKICKLRPNLCFHSHI